MRKFDVLAEKIESAHLTSMQKHCLIRVYHEEFSPAEVARLRGISRQAVSGHLHRAEKKLAAVGIAMPERSKASRIRARTNWSIDTGMTLQN